MRPVLYTGDIFRLQPRGGITRIFVEVMKRLERRHAVLAGAHVSSALDEVKGVARAAWRAPEFPGAPRLRALANRWVDRSLAAERAAIVHPTYYRDPGTLPRAAPVVATVYDMTHERFPELFRRPAWSAPDPARWKAALCRRADRVICISEVTRDDLVERLGIPCAKTRVIHLAPPDWSTVRPRPVRGIGKPFLLWVGERHTYKNFLPTLAAWAASPAARDTRLLCVGGPPFSPAERAAIARLGVAKRVARRALSEGELRWAYEHSVGLLYTSRWEGFGIPVLEAMALGTPVIAANAGAIPEVAGDDAILVESDDADSLRAGIERCLREGRDPAAAARRVARAARFTWNRTAAAHEAVYRELD